MRSVHRGIREHARRHTYRHNVLTVKLDDHSSRGVTGVSHGTPRRTVYGHGTTSTTSGNQTLSTIYFSALRLHLSPNVTDNAHRGGHLNRREVDGIELGPPPRALPTPCPQRLLPLVTIGSGSVVVGEEGG